MNNMAGLRLWMPAARADASWCGPRSGAVPRIMMGAVLVAALSGCMPGRDAAQSDAGSSGAVLYAENCAACHGPAGTPPPGLVPAPPDLGLIASRAGGNFPLVEVMAKIDGYTRDARGADAAMPSFGEALIDAPMVLVETDPGVLTPTPEPLVALAEHLRSLQR